MSEERCPVCDRAGCTRASLHEAIQCDQNRVDWRARYLAAEERAEYAKRMLHAIAKIARSMPVTDAERDAAFTILLPVITLLRNVACHASDMTEVIDEVDRFLAALALSEAS